MSTESLIVELDARTEGLEAALNRVNSRLDNTERSTNNAGAALKKMGSVAVTSGKAIIAAGTALSTMVIVAAKSRQELEQLTRQTGLATKDFQALAFATKQYGINAEQIADISKDLSDKLGEFASAGSGAFQDFADVMGLSKEAAKATAEEMQHLTSDQIIGKMIDDMEQAGKTGAQMTFVMESMGSDLSKLIPLFSDSGKELETLTSRFNKMNDEMSITETQARDLQGSAVSFDLMAQSMGLASTALSANLAPMFDSFFNSVIDVIPNATNTVIDFFNTFQEASAINSLSSTNRLIEEQAIKTKELQTQLENVVGVKTYNMSADQQEAVIKASLNREIDIETKRLEELEVQREKLMEQEAEQLALVEARKGGAITATGGDVNSGDEIEAIKQRFLTEEELLTAKYEKERELFVANKEDLTQLEQEYQDGIAEIKMNAEDAELSRQDNLLKRFKKGNEDDAKGTDKANKSKAISNESYLNSAEIIGDALFEDNKAVSAGLAIANTATGITKALATQNWPAAAATAVAGAAQLAAIFGAEKGGGSGTVASVPNSAPVAETPEQPTDLVTSSSDVSGSNQTIVLKIESDDSATADYISGILENAQVTGTIA